MRTARSAQVSEIPQLLRNHAERRAQSTRKGLKTCRIGWRSPCPIKQ